MKGPTTNFSDLAKSFDHGWQGVPMATVSNDDVPSQADIDCHAEMIGRDRGLVFCDEEPLGYYFVVAMPDGTRRSLRRHFVYASAKPGEVLEATRMIWEHIAMTFGQGRVWTLAGRATIIRDDDESCVPCDMISGEPHVRVRAIVVHENGPRERGGP